MTEDLIDIDTPPWVSVPVECVIALDSAGTPTFAPRNLPKWLAVLGRMIGEVTVTIERPRKKRSNAANRYLWGVVYKSILEAVRGFAANVGEEAVWKSAEDVHRAFKFRFLGEKTEKEDIHGVTFEQPVSTTKLTPKEFGEYVDKIKRMVAEAWQIYVPEPGDGPW